MELFSWDNFFNSDNIAVLCRTENEAKDFIKRACKNATFKQKWYSYGNTDEDTDWMCFEDQTCYFNNAFFGTLYNAQNHGYDIINWSDFMTDAKNPYDLKEKHLKSGYIVKLQDNRTYLILIHENAVYFLDSDNSYVQFNVEDYDNNLVNCINPNYTIIAIYNQKKESENMTTKIPIWSR